LIDETSCFGFGSWAFIFDIFVDIVTSLFHTFVHYETSCFGFGSWAFIFDIFVDIVTSLFRTFVHSFVASLFKPCCWEVV